jgi:alkanesulfonate monooxygenase SsuD/methylene tetrahydromethanopterin reductase-like flavin-dependent oxidoreductase (luciferase family)
MMQFGIFTVGDVTTDPTTGRTPTEHERIKAMVAIALKAEEVGLDVFATGEHSGTSRRRPRGSSSRRARRSSPPTTR